MPDNQSHPEPVISVNGVTLNVAQSMTVRVALESIAMQLSKESLGEDVVGKVIAEHYLARIAEVRSLMLQAEVVRRVPGRRAPSLMTMCASCGYRFPAYSDGSVPCSVCRSPAKVIG